MNAFITNIIDSRQKNANISPNINDTSFDIEDNDSNNTNYEPVSFNELPYILVSHVASYLDSCSISQFIPCNRHIAISCYNIPTTITALTQDWLSMYTWNNGALFIPFQLQNLSRFRMVKQLKLSVKDIILNNFKTHAVLRFDHLDNLIIVDIARENDDLNCTELMTNNKWFIDMLSTMNIKQLTFKNMRIFEDDKPIELFCCNKNIQCLSICQADTATRGFLGPIYYPKFHDHSILQQLENLKCLILHREKIIDVEWIVANLMKNLQSLHFNYDWTYCTKQQIEYPNLIELCLRHGKGVNKLIMSAKNLQRIYIYDFFVFEQTDTEFETLFNHQSLQYLRLYCYCNELVGKFMDSIIEAAKKTKHKRRNFKFELGILMNMAPVQRKEGMSVFEECIPKLVECLDQMTTKDFMLRLCVTGIETTLCLESVQSKYKVNMCNIQGSGQTKVIIMNKGNKMNGYVGNWMFKCDICDKHFF